MAMETHILTHEFAPFRGGIGLYVEETARALGECGGRPVLRGHDRGQAVIHLPRFGLVAVVRAVVERHAVTAPVHAEYPLAATQDLLAVVEGEAKAYGLLAGEVATLLGDEGFKKGMALYFERHDGPSCGGGPASANEGSCLRPGST